MNAAKLTDEIRAAILDCGITRYALSQRTGVPESVLSRFVNGRVGLTLDTLEKLAPSIGLRVSVRRPKGRA